MEDKLNSAVLEDRISELLDDLKEMELGSDQRSKEIENLRKLYALNLQYENEKYERFLKEQAQEKEKEIREKELNLRYNELSLRLKQLEFEKWRVKHPSADEILRCATVTGNLMAGTLIEKHDGIIIPNAFKGITNKIKL